jgi:uncharacterized protein YjiS (DUF1127 family)
LADRAKALRDSGRGRAGDVSKHHKKAATEMIMSTTFIASATAQDIAGKFRTLPSALKRWWMAYITWRIEQAAITQLSRMSDRELKDTGFTRPEITGAARIEAVRDHVLSRYY